MPLHVIFTPTPTPNFKYAPTDLLYTFFISNLTYVEPSKSRNFLVISGLRVAYSSGLAQFHGYCEVKDIHQKCIIHLHRSLDYFLDSPGLVAYKPVADEKVYS